MEKFLSSRELLYVCRGGRDKLEMGPEHCPKASANESGQDYFSLLLSCLPKKAFDICPEPHFVYFF